MTVLTIGYYWIPASSAIPDGLLCTVYITWRLSPVGCGRVRRSDELKARSKSEKHFYLELSTSQ
jgi:hypothetical protein